MGDIGKKVQVVTRAGDRPGEIVDAPAAAVLVAWQHGDDPGERRTDWFSRETLVRECDTAGHKAAISLRVIPKNILITGALGFLGRALGKRLHDLGHNVTGIDSFLCPPSGLPEFIMMGRGDVQWVVPETFAGYDIIYHLAAMSHVPSCKEEPLLAFQINVFGTSNVLDGVRQSNPGARIVIAGSGEEYGDGETLMTSDAANPNNLYGASKAAASIMAIGYAHTYKMRVNVARMANLYGPGQDERKFIPLVIGKLLRGEVVEIHNGGQPVRDWLYVEDAVNGYLALGLGDGKPTDVIVNMPGAQHEQILVTAFRIARALDELLPRADAVSYNTLLKTVPGGAQVGRTIMSGGDFDWQPGISLDAGLRLTVEAHLAGIKEKV